MVFAALLSAVLGTTCIVSCLGAPRPAAQADSHACCHKKSEKAPQHQQSNSGYPDSDCQNLTSELAKGAPQAGVPSASALQQPGDLIPPTSDTTPNEVVESSSYSRPDLLALHQTLLI